MKFEPKTNQIIFASLGLMCASGIVGAAFGSLNYQEIAPILTAVITGIFALMKDAD